MIRHLSLAMSSTFLASGTLHAGDTTAAKNVVLVDGFGLIHTGWPFRSLRKKLEENGCVCLEPAIRPKDARGGIEPLAESLKTEIEQRFGTEQPVSIVGFSMGGLISRYYLQHLGGSSRCSQLITISSPHNGTITAWLYPSRGAVQMRPNSEFLATLKQSEDELRDMPVVSYRTPLDLMILPASSSIWERAENRLFVSSMHHLMPHHRGVVRDVVSRLCGTPD